MASDKLIKVVPVCDIDDPKSYPSPLEEIIQDVIYKPTITTLWGKPESGKSHIALDLACTIALERNVLYIAAEAPHEIIDRVAAWKEYYEKEFNHKFHIYTEPIMLMLEKEVDTFIKSISYLKPDVIFIDPLADCFLGGDENAAKDMTVVMGHLKWIIRSLNCSVCVVAHTGWENKHERGSSALRGANRLSFKVEKTDEGAIEFKMVKRNQGQKIDSRFFSIKQIGDDYTKTILVPAEDEEVKNTIGLAKRQQELLVGISMNIFANGVTRIEFIKWAESNYNIPSSSVYDSLKKLMAKDLIEKKGSNMIVITDEGRTMADVIVKMTENTGKEKGIVNEKLNWILMNSNQFQSNSNELQSSENSIVKQDSNITTNPSPPKGEGCNNPLELDHNNDKKVQKLIN